LMGSDLRRRTKRSTPRLLDAIGLLKFRGQLNVRRFAGGDPTLLAMLTAEGRLK